MWCPKSPAGDGCCRFFVPRAEASSVQPKSQLMAFVNKVLLDRPMPHSFIHSSCLWDKVEWLLWRLCDNKHIYHLALSRKRVPTPVSQDKELSSETLSTCSRDISTARRAWPANLDLNTLNTTLAFFWALLPWLPSVATYPGLQGSCWQQALWVVTSGVPEAEKRQWLEKPLLKECSCRLTF